MEKEEAAGREGCQGGCSLVSISVSGLSVVWLFASQLTVTLTPAVVHLRCAPLVVVRFCVGPVPRRQLGLERILTKDVGPHYTTRIYRLHLPCMELLPARRFAAVGWRCAVATLLSRWTRRPKPNFENHAGGSYRPAGIR